MSIPPEYFERLYSKDVDPWGFRVRWYEQRKRDLTMACLPDARYRSCFEPGCSIGVLTSALAERCDEVLAMDVSAQAIEEAAPAMPAGVRLVRGSVPSEWPAGRFDLVVLSEVCYYLDHPACRRLADLAASSTAVDLVAVHWRHRVADYPLTGDEVHDHLGAAAGSHGLGPIVTHIEADLRIEVWGRDRRSIAARTGLLPL